MMNARVWPAVDISEAVPPLLPVLVYGQRKPLMKHYAGELVSGLIFWLILTTLVSHEISLGTLEYTALMCLPLALLTLAIFFGRGLPSLRVEAEAFYIDDDGRKRAVYWRDIGSIHYSEVDAQALLWWRSREDEVGLAAVDRANPRHAKESIRQIPVAHYFADPAREGPAFAAYMNRVRAHFVAATE